MEQVELVWKSILANILRMTRTCCHCRVLVLSVKAVQVILNNLGKYLGKVLRSESELGGESIFLAHSFC